ncbi:MAG TPA: BadF/BadG/BcrA/BcrD ATPase family protein [Candidatus Acidoferrales bacterium]|nr:BadF/BadG/BcrA/BcrD ATPase family protein [Candidatus Acidoferrales bacterium]
MEVFLGFDAGGTKTTCVVLDAAGHFLAETAGGPANPLRVGFAKASFALEDTALRALREARQETESVRAICAGVAGAGRPRIARRLVSYLSHAFPQAAVRVTTDIEIALEAAVGQDDLDSGKPNAGIVIVAGTGSAACGRNSAGKTARAGGWGPWIGDQGSAYDIGRRAVEAALRARDHLSPSTALGERILRADEGDAETPNTQDWDAILERIAKHPDAVFPKLFPVVAEAAAAGDAVAQQILAGAANSLASLANAVIDSLGLADQPFTLTKSGGVFGHSPHLDAALDRELSRVAPNARIAPARISPARAAAELARKSISDSAADGR